MRAETISRLALAVAVSGNVCSAIRTSSGLADIRREQWRSEAQDRTVALSVSLGIEDRYPARTISVPIDHFHNDSSYEPHSDDSFSLRYWFDPTYYQEGGPVIVLLGGETSGADRLQFMEKGILAKLANATGGMGVILEHRYYGKSFPFPDLSTESLRFLTTDQALADTAYFARNVVFDGFEDRNLTSHTTPYFAYGGSYAGAFAAFLRKLYPDVFYGAISSSGVPLAVYDYWQYFEAQRLYAPPDCVVTTQKLTHVVDNIAARGPKSAATARLKTAFGLGNVTDFQDFVNVLANGIRGWQDLNWDPHVSDPGFYEYCRNITSDELLYPQTPNLNATVRDLLGIGGYGDEADQLTPRMLNYIGFVNVTQVDFCRRLNRTQDECFGNLVGESYEKDGIEQEWRAWEYQVCTQWGYFLTGSGVPQTQLPLVSRLLDLKYLSFVCEHAFNISKPPDVEAINKHGGLNFSYPRLAFVDGEADPWLYAGTHAPAAPPRTSTASEPFLLIKGRAVHHWDENGLFPNETTTELPPPEIVETQRQEIEMLKGWIKQYRAHKASAAVDSELVL